MQIVVELGIRSQVLGSLTIATVFLTRSALMGLSGGGLNSSACANWMDSKVRHANAIDLRVVAILRLTLMSLIHRKILRVYRIKAAA